MSEKSQLRVVIGLGKTGLSLVRHLVKQGFDNVAVVDSRESPPGLEEFQTSFSDIPLYLGGFHPEVLKQAEELVVTSGVPLSTPEIAEQMASGIPAIGDIELFARCVTAPIIAITGSNGKSTTTSFVGEMAKCAGVDVRVGGNLGTPALELIGNSEPELYVIEISNFQLEKTDSLKAAAATILNISQNHPQESKAFLRIMFSKINIICPQRAIRERAKKSNTYVASLRKYNIFSGSSTALVFLNDFMVTSTALTISGSRLNKCSTHYN